MQRDVEDALRRAAEFRRQLLQSLSPQERVRLLEDLFVDFFVTQWKVLLKWSALTGQSSQVDTGYIGQHIASILFAEPGQGFKGKGLDLLDGSEVKSAAIISGVDRPRWNHGLGTLAQDEKRQQKGRTTTSAGYLASPNVFYLLFDRVVHNDPSNTDLILRVRGWCLDGQKDTAWRDLVQRYASTRTAGKQNLQLHPPVGWDDDIVVNSLGNLDFADIKVFEARIHGLANNQEYRVEWVKYPPDQLRPVTGRTSARPFVKKQRPSRLSSAADVLPDVATLRELLPGHDLSYLANVQQQVEATLFDEAAAEELSDSSLNDDPASD